MKREVFISKFNEYFQKNESKFFSFSIEVKEFTNDLEFKEKYYERFIPFFENIGVKNKYSILDKIENNKRYDDYYEEDNPDSEFCAFICQININNLYDMIKNVENYKEYKKDIFRIEGKENKGLYDTFFATLPVDEINHPNPRKDISFDGIFDVNNNDYKYFQKWSFGFKDLKDLKNWIMTDENQERLENSNCILKKITLDEDYIINGNKQLIFQSEKILNEETIDWKEIIKYNKNIKFKK